MRVDTKAAREFANSGYSYTGEEVRAWVHNMADELDRLRGIVANGRAAYSAYGLLATPPNHDMHTEAGDKLRGEWLRETDDYLRGLAA